MNTTAEYSSAPQVTKEKELTLHDLCSSQKGLEQMPLAWHLRLPHPTWEESVSHFLDSVSFAAGTQPSITCREGRWAASTQTTLILFEQAARPDTPPALLNVHLATR